MTLGAGGGEVTESNGGIGFGGGFYGVDGAMTGSAFRRVGVAVLSSLPMDARGKRLDFVAVALIAFGGHELFGCGKSMNAAMASGAGGIAEGGVRAFFEVFDFLIMAGGALNLGDFGGVREFLDGGVTILAAENAVSAGGVFCGVDGDIFTGGGFHTSLAMASEALLVRSRNRCRPGQEQGGSQSGEHLDTFLSTLERENL